MVSIAQGYKAYNGHIFTQAEANWYNKACVDCLKGVITQRQQHKIFMSIVYK